jgi:molecular chaperone GrpE
VLADFRAWLGELANPERERRGEFTPSLTVGVRPELYDLVAQFTALRHEVNMQTKASRAAVEQLAAKPSPPPVESDEGRAQAKALVDIADALSLSLRQVEKFRDAVEPLVAEATAAPPGEPYSPGFLARLFGAKPVPAPGPRPGTVEKIRQFAASAADGYALSLRRVERALPAFGLEPISIPDGKFDPELMEVVDVAEGGASGSVVEVVRAGYRWRGKVFRFAQVKVAR